MVTNILKYCGFCFCCLFLFTCEKTEQKTDATGTLKITFTNSVKGVPIGLNNTIHTNSFGEQYTITKFKYYISNVGLSNNTNISVTEKESYHLIDEVIPANQSFTMPLPVSKYSTLKFTLGVDSTRNVSGAQTGALDPLNDMFWTWNSGYIMAKLEATSPQSTAVNNRIQYHVGGFSGANNVLKNCTINVDAGSILDIREGKTSEIIIAADVNTWWQGTADVRIAQDNTCHSPGSLANKLAGNYTNMFQLKQVINN
jgi:hypothetical protein